MAKGIMLVETQPASPDRVDEYNKWYDEVHLPEVCSVPGFVSARRFKPVDGQGGFVAIYELESDDVAGALAALGEAIGKGQVSMSDVLCMDPPPSMRVLETTTVHGPASA